MITHTIKHHFLNSRFKVRRQYFDEKLGLFILKMKDEDPHHYKFLTKWKNKLDIGDSSLFVLRNKQMGYKELVISYKSIFINTYSVTLMDISTDKDQVTLFRHESFQLWESAIKGMILENNKDFATLSKTGVNILALGS